MGGFGLRQRKAFLVRLLHIVARVSAHKILIVVHLFPPKARAKRLHHENARSSRIMRAEIMTRSSDNAIAIINWMWNVKRPPVHHD